MTRRSISVLGVLSALLGLSALAQAATISGTIKDSVAVGISMAEVRLWTVGVKDDTLTQDINAASDGTYTFTAVAAGSYKVDARPPAGGPEYTDRWYDVAAPNGNGYVGSDADLITVMAATAQNGIDITLEAAGGLDGTVLVGMTPVAGMQVRVQQSAIPQLYHGDLSQVDPHLGLFSMHDLPPALNYQLLIHDPLGANDTFIDIGPYTVTAGMDSPLTPSTLSAMPTDPYEPNNLNTDMNSQINGALFRQTPPQPFKSAGAIIAPRGSDLDWYCFNALSGDRYLLDVVSNMKVGAAIQEDPWVDPMVSWWSVNAGGMPTKLLENDDANATTRASHLDTMPLTATGTYCAAVTTFGDTAWSGSGQSAGHYDLTIAMGNRPPVAAATYNGLPTPIPSAFIQINEGDNLQIDLTYSDPDSDPLTVTAAFLDSSSNPATGSTFNSGGGMGTFTWQASYTATRNSPYTVTFSVADAEFTTQIPVIIKVAAVNLPPTTPVLLTPVDGGSVKSYTPLLSFQESTDLNDDALVYDLDLTYGDGGAQQGQVDGGVDGGPTSWTVGTPIPEDSWVNWRARAFDGNATNGYSPWTDPWIFYVNVIDEPPTAPVFTKPADGDLMVMVVRPALEVGNPVSVDNNPITIQFEIATDAAFTNIVLKSPAVPMNTQSATMPSTSWVPTMDLGWGMSYYARAVATSTPGGAGPYSNVNHFAIKPYQAPSNPAFLSPFLTTCNGLIATSASELAAIQVGPSTSPEGAAVTIQLQIFVYTQTPDTATPVFDAMLPSTSPSANFNTSSVTFAAGARYLFRTRAYDGMAYSAWVSCDASNGPPDAGSGASSGKTGCSCATGPEASAGLLFGVVALTLWRRRRPSAA
jgi:MYXO-CTERM domain-containing protein